MAIHPSLASNVKQPYLVEKIVDFSVTAATASATVTTLAVPAESMVLTVGFEKTSAMTGTSADVTLTGKVGATAFTGAYDLDAGAVGSYAAPGALTPAVSATATTVDLVFNAFTGTVTGGKVRVFAVLLDVSDAAKPGLAALKS
jgi:hypothetical protein